MYKLFLIPAYLVLLSGCATVFTGTSQTVNMSAIGQPGQKELENVNCTVIDSSGAVYSLVSNPGIVVVSKGIDPLQVQCKENGYKNYTGAINSSFNAVTLLDIFFWPTFFVDLATGAMWKYPVQYAVMMSPREA